MMTTVKFSRTNRGVNYFSRDTDNKILTEDQTASTSSKTKKQTL